MEKERENRCDGREKLILQILAKVDQKVKSLGKNKEDVEQGSDRLEM